MGQGRSCETDRNTSVVRHGCLQFSLRTLKRAQEMRVYLACQATGSRLNVSIASLGTRAQMSANQESRRQELGTGGWAAVLVSHFKSQPQRNDAASQPPNGPST